MLAQEMESPKYMRFNVSAVTFKIVHGHEIQAYVLVPKNISPGKHPLLVKIHGGGFVCGSGLFSGWFPQYLLDLAVENNAILVAPNYRQLPESAMLEQLADIDDFWKWTRSSSFQVQFQPHKSEVDVKRTLVYGDSAGGYHAVQSALSQPADTFRAVLVAYPMLDIDDAYYNTAFEKHPFGAPMLPKSLLEDHLAAMHPDPTKRQLASDNIPDPRLSLVLSIIQQGRLVEFFGKDDKVYPMRMLKRREEKLPYMLFYHGDADSAVMTQDSVKFVGEMRNRFDEESVKLHIEEGAEHGFDSDFTLAAIPSWMNEQLKTVIPLWLN